MKGARGADVLVLGAGLAGLAAARALRKRGADVCVLEAEAEPGGHCRTVRTGGFAFDYTGHYLHLRYPATTAFLAQVLGGLWPEIERRASVHFRSRRVPFPFQANLHVLPAGERARVLADYVEALRAWKGPLPGDTPFDTWSRATFGAGLSALFMEPYNQKLLRTDLHEVTSDWVAWSVPQPAPEEVFRGALGLSNRAFGYNPSFRYPREGGIDHLVQALAKGIAVRLREPVRRVHLRKRIVATPAATYHYDRVVNTLPLHHFTSLIDAAPACARAARQRLRANCVLNVNLGFEGRAPSRDHWIYYPEPDVPFYRVGLPGNVCRAMAPAGHYSLSVEIALPSPASRAPSQATLLAALQRVGLVRKGARPVVTVPLRMPHAYVIHDAWRLRHLDALLEDLRTRGVFCAGRWGQWKYSFMEAAIKEGLEAADWALEGAARS